MKASSVLTTDLLRRDIREILTKEFCDSNDSFDLSDVSSSEDATKLLADDCAECREVLVSSW